MTISSPALVTKVSLLFTHRHQCFFVLNITTDAKNTEAWVVNKHNWQQAVNSVFELNDRTSKTKVILLQSKPTPETDFGFFQVCHFFSHEVGRHKKANFGFF